MEPHMDYNTFMGVSLIAYFGMGVIFIARGDRVSPAAALAHGWATRLILAAGIGIGFGIMG